MGDDVDTFGTNRVRKGNGAPLVCSQQLDLVMTESSQLTTTPDTSC